MFFTFFLRVTKHFSISPKNFCETKIYPLVGRHGVDGLEVVRVGAGGGLESVEPITSIVANGLVRAALDGESPRSSKLEVSISMYIWD